MNKAFRNPYLNSVYAEAYIIFVVSIMHFLAKPNTPDTFFDPIAFLSLLVLSVAVMGYLFFGVPLQLFLEGGKKESIAFFLKTAMSFAAVTALTLVIVSSIPR